MKNTLAIIIPAYKAQFLDNTLESLANQTCMDFNLYIGDDASPYNLYEIVKKYENKLNFVYKRFETNYGSKSLTKNWERCIDLSENEQFIWLFSDDDMVSSNAVELFYNEIKHNDYYDVYRFNLRTINENNEIIEITENLSEVQSNINFFYERISDNILSCITQYIFSREVYKQNSGFVEFPFAWSSDDATVIAYSGKTGIKTIENVLLFWRIVNGCNITANSKYEKQRASAEFQYAKWFNKYFKETVNKKILKKYSQIYFEKRLNKLPIKYFLNIQAINCIIKILGLSGILLIGKHLYFKLKLKTYKNFIVVFKIV